MAVRTIARIEAALLPIWNQMSEADRLVFIDKLRQQPGALEEFQKKLQLEARRASGTSRWPTTMNMMQDVAPPSERLTPDHQRILNNILLRTKTEKGLRITVSMAPQSGKPLCVLEDVFTPDGWRKFGTLRPGDFVFGSDGRPTKVLAIHPQGIRPLMKITFKDGSSVRCTPDHKWSTRTRYTRRARTHSTTEILDTLTTGGRQNHAVPRGKPSTGGLPGSSVPIDPWLLGYWLGNGTSAKPEVTTHRDDADYVQDRIHELGFDTSRADRTDAHSSSIRIKKFSQVLRDINLLNNKHIPSCYFDLDYEGRRALMVGLMDSDGHLNVQERINQLSPGNEITMIDKSMMEDVQLLAFSLGERPHLEEKDATLNGRFISKAWRLSWRPKICLFESPRKSSVWVDVPYKEILDWVTVQNVEEDGQGEAMCITVANDDHLFMIGKACVLTHNSSLLSKYGPLWMFDNNPDSRIHVIGYNVSMATKQTRPMRDMIRAFPEYFSFQLDPKLQRADYFAATGRQGFIRATGIYGGITGYPATDIIVDDPIKDIREARSPVVSAALWDQFRSSVLTRLPTGNENLIIIHTRWAMNDLIGRCHTEQGLKSQGGTWEHINVPAICFDPATDPLGRQLGEGLWTERISMEAWNKIKETQAEFWFSMYQGTPTPPGGGVFKMKNARFFTTHGSKVQLIKEAGLVEEPKIIGQFITIDLAVSTATTADNTAIAFWQFTDKNELILRDMIAGRIAGPEQLPTVYSMWQKWGASFPIFAESVQYQLAFIQAAEKAGLPIYKFQPKGTKEVRSVTAQALWRAKGIYLPQNAPWLADYLLELERFPDGGGHDDMVDVTSMAAIVRVWPEVLGRKRKKKMGAFLKA